MKKTVRASAARRHQTSRKVAASVAVGCILATAGLASAGSAQADTPTKTADWNITLSSKPFALASPMVATLDSAGPSIVIGSRSGYEYAVHMSDRREVSGWPVPTNGAAVDATASVLGAGSGAKLFFGEGTSASPSKGTMRARNANGKTLWTKTPQAVPGKGTAGVMSSISIGNLQSGNDVISGSMGQMQDMVTSTGTVGLGFPWFQADSNFSTPALADPTNSGHDEIIEGGDSTKGNALNTQYQNGGHIRILSRTGNHGTGKLNGGLKCQYNTNQTIYSSPAVGHFFGNKEFGITVGTGTFYKGVTDGNKEIAVDNNCKLRWRTALNGATDSSPALANVMGTGSLSVVQGTRLSATDGRVYALSGVTGKIQWGASIPGGVYGGITTADLGGGYQDVIAPTPTGIYVLDGKTGHLLYRLGGGYGFQNTALVTKDSNGTVGITGAGYNSKGQGVLMHWSFAGTNGGTVTQAGSWPMFHHDQKLTGNADRPVLNPIS